MKHKVMIAIPCMDQVPALFAQSLCLIRKGDNNVEIAMQMGSLVYTSRNNLAVRAAKTEADYVLWLDSDMMFRPDLLIRLQKTLEENELDIVSGLYFRRTTPFTPVMYKTLDIKDDGCEWTEFDEVPEELTEVAGCGFGCVLMKTSVLAHVQYEFGDMFGPLTHVGEDLAFCWRARQLGYKVYVDPEIEAGHIGYTVVNRGFYKSFKKAHQKGDANEG